MVFNKNMTTHVSCSQLWHCRRILFLRGPIYPTPPGSCSLQPAWQGPTPSPPLCWSIGPWWGCDAGGGACLLPPQSLLPPVLQALPGGMAAREYSALVMLDKLELYHKVFVGLLQRIAVSMLPISLFFFQDFLTEG